MLPMLLLVDANRLRFEVHLVSRESNDEELHDAYLFEGAYIGIVDTIENKWRKHELSVHGLQRARLEEFVKSMQGKNDSSAER